MNIIIAHDFIAKEVLVHEKGKEKPGDKNNMYLAHMSICTEYSDIQELIFAFVSWPIIYLLKSNLTGNRRPMRNTQATQWIRVFSAAETTFSTGMRQSQEVFLSFASDICIARSIPNTARLRALEKWSLLYLARNT